jgi:hypothetical protein
MVVFGVKGETMREIAEVGADNGHQAANVKEGRNVRAVLSDAVPESHAANNDGHSNKADIHPDIPEKPKPD